ncbi:unnamed protein product [Closterium sp. NIES-64]|nr:unnamed protein product [Closterium sp. NIES-64]
MSSQRLVLGLPRVLPSLTAFACAAVSSLRRGYAAHQLNLWPRVSRPEVSPTSLWTGSIGVASRFGLGVLRLLSADTSADKLSPRALELELELELALEFLVLGVLELELGLEAGVSGSGVGADPVGAEDLCHPGASAGPAADTGGAASGAGVWREEERDVTAAEEQRASSLEPQELAAAAAAAGPR